MLPGQKCHENSLMTNTIGLRLLDKHLLPKYADGVVAHICWPWNWCCVGIDWNLKCPSHRVRNQRSETLSHFAIGDADWGIKQSPTSKPTDYSLFIYYIISICSSVRQLLYRVFPTWWLMGSVCDQWSADRKAILTLLWVSGHHTIKGSKSVRGRLCRTILLTGSDIRNVGSSYPTKTHWEAKEVLYSKMNEAVQVNLKNSQPLWNPLKPLT